MSSEGLRVVRPDGFSDLRATIARLNEHVIEAEGHAAVNEAVWRDLDAPQPDSMGVMLDDVAAAHVARSD
ncbi:MAG TPA: hypothetical protein VFR41_11885, partial [Acidimicrobiia bacterium]|nr:hypothetical protein [Acidimicrobiia bacterium]